MSAALYAEVGGSLVPLADCDWTLWKPCGCLQAIAVASQGAHLIPDEYAAWKQFYDRVAERKKAAKNGMRVELITHERWRTELMDAFGTPCPHKPEAGAS